MLLSAYYSFDFLFCIYWCWWYWASALRDRSGNCNIKFAEMEAHIHTKLLKSRRSFGYLKHSVPYNIPSGVKYNLFKGLCSRYFYTVILLGIQKWLICVNSNSWTITDWNGAMVMPIILDFSEFQTLYQYVISLLNETWDFSLLWDRNCLKFNDFYTLVTKDVCLRAGDHERLLVSRCKKTLAEKSLFLRSERVVNDAADVLWLKLSLFFLSHSVSKSDIRKRLMKLRDQKFDYSNSCSRKNRCRCSNCIA